MFRTMLGITALATMLAGCAYVTAVPAPPGSDVNGIRFYDVKPLLIVNESTISVELVPNPNKAYALQFGSFLAKHDLVVDLDRGFIKKIDSKQDTTKFIEFLTEVAKRIIPTPPVKGTSSQTKDGVPRKFQVYDIVFDNFGNLVALRPLIGNHTLISVPALSRSSASAQGTPEGTVKGTSGSARGNDPSEGEDLDPS